MTIREQFLIVQKDVIEMMDKRFVDYLIDDVKITFKDQYPQKFEHSLLSGTFNSKVLIDAQPKNCETIYADDDHSAILLCSLKAKEKGWFGGVAQKGAFR